MNNKKSQKAWIFVLKGSVLPLIVSAAIFTLFLFVYNKYSVWEKEYLDKALYAFLVLLITYWVCKITVSVLNWYALTVAVKTKTDLDDKFIPLLRRIFLTIIWTIGLIIILGRLGVNISALVTALGVGSLAIALAAQDTIANIIAGFLIMIDNPFCVGDDIVLPSGERVKVLEIGIRRSKFASQDNAVIIMPNLQLSKSKITNYTHGKNSGNV